MSNAPRDKLTREGQPHSDNSTAWRLFCAIFAECYVNFIPTRDVGGDAAAFCQELQGRPRIQDPKLVAAATAFVSESFRRRSARSLRRTAMPGAPAGTSGNLCSRGALHCLEPVALAAHFDSENLDHLRVVYWG